MGAIGYDDPVVPVLSGLRPARISVGLPLRRLGGALIVVALAAGCVSAPSASLAPRPVTDGESTAPGTATYTADQAERGERVFDSVCGTCHASTEFRGQIFELTWMAEPVGHLFQHISTAMPQDMPGSLSPVEYASIVAYLLRLNGRPAGERELPADADRLGTMRWR
ncbi:MAG: c-type cytochrome [Gemmatimonadota bacterium]